MAANICVFIAVFSRSPNGNECETQAGPTAEDQQLTPQDMIVLYCMPPKDIPVDAGINQNPEEIGRIAVEMLVALIKMNVCGEPSSP